MNQTDTEIYHVSIPKEELNKLPAEVFNGKIIVVDNPAEVDEALAVLRKEPFVGFDTETKPNFKKGCHNKVALLQFSTQSHCFLFRLCKIGLTQSLRQFIEDESIRKIGLSIHDDFHNLRILAPELNPGGFIDLQPFVKDFLISDNSLSRIHAIIFGKRISKSQQLSNWEASELKNTQCQYAALDAYACLNIYQHLSNVGFVPENSKYYKKVEPALPKED